MNLQITKEQDSNQVRLKLEFSEPKSFERKQYPVRGKIAITARFNGCQEWRRMELRFWVEPEEDQPEPDLFDEPTFVKVTSRKPVIIWKEKDDDPKAKRRIGDTHVRLKWDGKDRLLSGPQSTWRLTARLVEPKRAAQPALSFSDPKWGRFELLISPRAEWMIGDQFMIEVTATHKSGRTFTTSFVAGVREHLAPEPPQPRLLELNVLTGSNRRPPYELRYIGRDQYDMDFWGEHGWTDDDPGCYHEPTERNPLVLIINKDMAAFEEYRKALLRKRLTETEVERRTSKYTSHIAYHLYQMYQDSTKQSKEQELVVLEEQRRQRNPASRANPD